MKPHGETAALAEMKKAAQFIKKSVRSDVPANVFILIDTHSDTMTGALQWGVNQGSPLQGTTSELLRKFCGDDFMCAMKEASDVAQALRFLAEEAEWYDASPYSRGGWRGLLLSACASVMRVPESFQDLKGLVER